MQNLSRPSSSSNQLSTVTSNLQSLILSFSDKVGVTLFGHNTALKTCSLLYNIYKRNCFYHIFFFHKSSFPFSFMSFIKIKLTCYFECFWEQYKKQTFLKQKTKTLFSLAFILLKKTKKYL